MCSGNIKMEPGAVVCRVSPSFIRFGTFQLPASRGGSETMLVQALADYVIKHHYPHLKGELLLSCGTQKYTRLLSIRSQGQAVAACTAIVALRECCRISLSL